MSHLDDLPSPVTAAPVWRLTVAQYHAMIRTGILTDQDPVELLDGLLIAKMPKNPRHRAVTRLVRQALEAVIPPGWYVDSQEPVTLADSEPEPDVMIVRGDTRDYLDRHPGPADLALVVEVADSTLQRDRELKRRLYARAGIRVYWLVSLPEWRVEVYSDVDEVAEVYRERVVHDQDGFLPVTVGEETVNIPVADVFP